MARFMRVEDLKVYQKLCQLHIEVCELTRTWPSEERFELGSQVRRSSNRLKNYISKEAYETLRGRYQECIRMLNGLERTLERQLDDASRRWPQVAEPPT